MTRDDCPFTHGTGMDPFERGPGEQADRAAAANARELEMAQNAGTLGQTGPGTTGRCPVCGAIYEEGRVPECRPGD